MGALRPLTEDEQGEVERLSALDYSLEDMAMYLDIPFEDFKRAAEDAGSDVAYRIKRGKLVVRANYQMNILASAESGNITAMQQLAKILKERDFNDALKSINDE